VTEAGTTLVARYELTAPLRPELAAGPAWVATDQVLDRDVRVTLPEGSHVAATLDAARRAALVIDPRLARVLDVGVERVPVSGTPAQEGAAQDVAYVVTEPYIGTSLTDLPAGGTLDARQARAIVGEAASALESARRRGLHHEALRPECVRIVGSKVLVTGLGIDGPVSGLENLDGDAASRADAVGLVSLLYYLLTARWPSTSLDTGWLAPEAPRPLPAPGSAGTPAPVTSLAPAVPVDLAALCDATLAPRSSDGPRTPAEVVDALEPWGPVDLSRPVERTSVLHVDAPGPAAPAATPTPPTRTSALGGGAAGVVVGGAAGSAGTAANGTPAAQALPVTGDPRWGLAGAPGGGYDASGTSGTPQPAQQPVPPSQPYWAPAGGPAATPSMAVPATTGERPPRSVAELERHTFNPTRYVLILFLIGLVVATGVAVVALTHNFKPALVYSGAQPSFGATSAPAPEPTAGSTPQATKPPEDVRPEISKGAQVDPPPQGDNNEHPEAVDRAFDGDLNSYWYSRTYSTPEFGGLKSGIGYAITLKKAAPVSTIILDTNNKGGHVEVRATTASDPTKGAVLASGSFSADTTLSFDKPVTAKNFVLWFSELPKTPDGQYRIELNEIQIS
jgi:hypothetical protein